QELMGKSFYNRGPYEMFYFLPSLLLPGIARRLFFYSGTPHNRQILFVSLREPKKQQQEKTVAALRALADPTRYKILILLAKNGPVNGQDIAKSLKLAPSTVSHHMSALQEHGLVTEEPVRSTKFYGISRGTLKTLLSEIAEDFELS
ncbi:MAG: winged helix-turn-helix transcriptional regulator, partial [Oscillospiraceae bacterium]|nr:winged helix-turn-helix transcriptional regulator [Oscillospiraceae bacterium]